MSDKDFYEMQKVALNGCDFDWFPRAFWDEVIRREGGIDPVKYGVGMCQAKGTPNSTINGKKTYRRIFIRLRSPYETLTTTPIRDGEDFAKRVSIIEGWFNSVCRIPNLVLEFSAYGITDEEAELMQHS